MNLAPLRYAIGRVVKWLISRVVGSWAKYPYCHCEQSEASPWRGRGTCASQWAELQFYKEIFRPAGGGMTKVKDISRL
jgi:hypothetical protein